MDPVQAADTPAPADQSSPAPLDAMSAPAATVQSQAAEEVFKVPALPTASTSAPAASDDLPADIAAILAVGAHIGDDYPTNLAGEPRASTSNYEQVVKDLRAKAGFAEKQKEEGEGAAAMEGATAKADGLDEIEREMEKEGVTRENEAAQEEMEGVEGDAEGRDEPAKEE